MSIPSSFSAADAARSVGKYLLARAGKELHCLQIGASTSDASTYLLQNVLTNAASTLTDVDTWPGSGLANETSNDFFQRNTQLFDFIYVDGNRSGPHVLQDGMNAVRCLAPHGLLAFNDSAWRQKNSAVPGPSPAISALIDVFSDEVTVLEANNLVWMQRI